MRFIMNGANQITMCDKKAKMQILRIIDEGPSDVGGEGNRAQARAASVHADWPHRPQQLKLHSKASRALQAALKQRKHIHAQDSPYISRDPNRRFTLNTITSQIRAPSQPRCPPAQKLQPQHHNHGAQRLLEQSVTSHLRPSSFPRSNSTQNALPS